jgi:hypothetical protein
LVRWCDLGGNLLRSNLLCERRVRLAKLIRESLLADTAALSLPAWRATPEVEKTDAARPNNKSSDAPELTLN